MPDLYSCIHGPSVTGVRFSCGDSGLFLGQCVHGGQLDHVCCLTFKARQGEIFICLFPGGVGGESGEGGGVGLAGINTHDGVIRLTM